MKPILGLGIVLYFLLGGCSAASPVDMPAADAGAHSALAAPREAGADAPPAPPAESGTPDYGPEDPAGSGHNCAPMCPPGVTRQ